MRFVIASGIYPPEIGGPAGYVKGLATELVKRGHQVAVVTYGDERTETNEERKTHNAKRITKNEGSENTNVKRRTNIEESGAFQFEVIVVMRSAFLVMRYFRYMLAVHRLARKADLVFLQGPVSEGLPGMLGALWAGKPVVLKVVGDYAWEQYQQQPITNYELRITNSELLDEFLTHRHGGKVWLMEAIERWVAKRVKRIIVPSKYLKTVVERWGIEEEKIEVVYNSIAPLPPPVIPAKAGIQKENGSDGSPTSSLGLLGDDNKREPKDDKKKVILTAVRAVPWKGVDFLCDCLKDLPENFVLAVAGEGPCLEDWKRHAQTVGVSDRVMWLGRLARAELAAWYRQADLFVLATGYEGFPHVVVEACSVGLPCIVSDRGGNPETKDFFPELVTVVPYRDKTAWVEAIKLRITNYELRNRERAGGRGTVVLSFDRMVEETEAVLKS